MKQMSLTTVAIAASTFACAALLSFDWSGQRGLSLSVEKAEARVGRPLTPVSVAGVARRQNRRAAYGAAGATEMARYGNGPNDIGGLVGGDDPGTYAVAPAPGPYYQRGGYYAGGPYYGGPYYGGSVRGANAAYYGGYAGVAGSPGVWTGGVSSSDYALYIRNLRDSGYNTKNNFNTSGNVAQQ
jgi:hypothetical protein